MKYRALVSFCGLVSMHAEEVRELDDVKIIRDLLGAGYIEEVKPVADKAKAKEKERAKK